MIDAYPLCWPPDYQRSTKQIHSRFKSTLGRARDFVKEEIRRIGGTSPVISTNIPLKNDGDLRADWNRFRIDDVGVAVYFTKSGNQVCLCCDNYGSVWENLHAIGRTIEALRQIDRDGVSDFLNRTFTGFKALPAPASLTEDLTWETLCLSAKPADIQLVHAAYKRLAKERHPDTPTGSTEAFHELNTAYQKALKTYS